MNCTKLLTKTRFLAAELTFERDMDALQYIKDGSG